MSGFVDIHSHILWGLDDGPPDLKTSVEILRMAAAGGTSDMVATPHANHRYPFDPDLVLQRIEELSAAAPVPRIHTGCDFHLQFENIKDCIDHPAKYTINHLRYLMVEFPDLSIPKSSTYVFDHMLNAGITPVITHPERNQPLMKDVPQLISWIHLGCLIQVTAQSFIGRFGKAAQNSANELLARGMVHFVASDAHDPAHRPPELQPAYRHIEAKHGKELADRLFITQPAATLTGALIDVDLPEIVTAKRKWFLF